MYTYIGKNDVQYKANLHSHSVLSDGKLTPRQLRDAYRNHGYSVLAITDHEYPFDHSDLNCNDFLMLTGYEAYIRPNTKCKFDPFQPEVHFNLISNTPHNTSYIGYDSICCKYIPSDELKNIIKKGPYTSRKFNSEYINLFIRSAVDSGYTVTYNHPYWSMQTYEDIMSYSGYNGIEIFNYNSYLINGLEYNAALYDALLRSGRKINCHSCDDNHNKAPFDDIKCDSFGGFDYIVSDKLEYSSIMKAINQGKFYSSSGPIIKELIFDNKIVYIKTSNVKRIIMYYGGKNTLAKYASFNSSLTEAQFDIPIDAKYIRFDIIDELNKHANTKGFFKDEI